jgi:hypothetical protein
MLAILAETSDTAGLFRQSIRRSCVHISWPLAQKGRRGKHSAVRGGDSTDAHLKFDFGGPSLAFLTGEGEQ